MNPELDSVPDPVFLEHLEWQLRTELRREARFAPSKAASPVWKRARTAALVAASLVLGGATVVAAERVQQSREAEILAAKASVRIEAQRSRAELAEKRLAETTARAAAGITTQAEVQRAELAHALESLVLQRAQVDLTEVQLSGREPRDELDAPLVGGQDFVAERLQLDLLGARARLTEQESSTRWLERMAEAGFVASSELERARSEVLGFQGQAQAAVELLDLRRSFLSGALARERVWLLGERARSAAGLGALRARIELARTAVERLDRQAAAGVTSEREVDEARQGLVAQEAECRLLELEMERLEVRLRE
jgi:hypothetical protein